MSEPGALDERLRTLVMQSFEGGGERLRKRRCGINFDMVWRVDTGTTYTDGIIYDFLDLHKGETQFSPSLWR